MQANTMVLIPNIGKIETKVETTKLIASCLGVKPCLSNVLNFFQILTSLDFIFYNYLVSEINWML